MANAKTVTVTATADMIQMGLEVEVDLAEGEGLAGKAEAVRNLLRAIEEVGDVAMVLEIVRTAALGASEMHPGDETAPALFAFSQHMGRAIAAIA